MKKYFELKSWLHKTALVLILGSFTGAHAAPSDDTRALLNPETAVARPLPLLNESVSFDIFSASFFMAEENLLTLGDTYLTFKNLRFPETRIVKDDERYTFQFVGLSLSFISPTDSALCAASEEEPTEDAYLSTISIDADYDHRIILVLPTTGSILDLKLKGDGSSPLDTERLSTYLKKAKTLFDKEFNETKTRVIKSELGVNQGGIQSYELLFETSAGQQKVVLTANFTKGTLSLKIDLPSNY